MNFKSEFSCPDCGISIEEIEAKKFSFLIIHLGHVRLALDLDIRWSFRKELMIPDPSLSINEGAITVMGWQSCADKNSFGCNSCRIM